MRNAIAGLGFDQDAAMVVFPISNFLVGSDISAVEQAFDKFVDGLTSWEARAKATGLQEPARLNIDANGFEAALDKMNRQFLMNNWGDGLPLNAPSQERVDWILTGTELARDHLLGKVLPRGGITTVETLAISLAMAGGRPEYLPVLTAAMQAILDPALEHDKWQATSAATFPVVIVNGPIAKQIRVNSGFGLLGPDPQHPAGASIGRAIRLLLQNVGGALPGIGTMSMYGGMRTVNCVFAEDEDGLPPGWSTVAEDHLGLARGTNAVTVYVATGGSNIVRRGVGKEAPDEEALQGLRRVAGYLQTPNIHYAHGWAHGTPGALLMSRIVANQIAGLGWSKERIKQFLWDNSQLPSARVEEDGIRQWIEAAPDAETLAAMDRDPWPISRTPEQMILCVAGGHHPTHNFWLQANSRTVTGGAIALPGNWDMLVAQADEDLGMCEGGVCAI